MDSPKYYSLIVHNSPLVVVTLTQAEYNSMTAYYRGKAVDISQRFDDVVKFLTSPNAAEVIISHLGDEDCVLADQQDMIGTCLNSEKHETKVAETLGSISTTDLQWLCRLQDPSVGDINTHGNAPLHRRPLSLEQLTHLRGVFAVELWWKDAGPQDEFLIEINDTHVRVITIWNDTFVYKRSRREEWCSRLVAYTQASKEVQSTQAHRLWGTPKQDLELKQADRLEKVVYVQVL